ncbi:unnamed protein product [Clonostachys solani]|uniref:Zn(2)-C6 fungal-type domain-containing protein n=1 Tax=Clonostachys solani TaxID=160281 RepID=A0A9N9W5P3_9HYPO|nr:unnamed protein product [Clonostachys solani]
MATTLTNKKYDADPPPPPPRQIRFVNNQGQPPSKRRRITAACLTCRRRKTRCAGERPKCSTCTKNGHKCLGYPEEKKDGGDAGDGKVDDFEERPDIEDSIEEDDKKPKKLANIITTQQPHQSRRRSGPASSPQSSTRPFTNQHGNTASPTVPSKASASPTMLNAPTAASSAHPMPAQSMATHNSLTSEDPGSPSMRRSINHSHRVPYFRYFGPTAIVPGFKQMVVSVRDRRRSTNGSHSGASPLSNPSGIMGSTSAADSEVILDDPPIYDPNDPGPVNPFILSLARTFFLHLGCNYPFLQERNFMRLVREKRAEPILVDAVCALAARFSDSPILTGGNEKMPKTERGQAYAHRAKRATVDTFPCPTVAAVQACLLMAYEGFGANQDSALWMYLGLAIRMAIDLGLQKRVGVQYQGEHDPWNTQQRTRNLLGDITPDESKSESNPPSQEEQKELEQERIDTFWTVFILDRFISSGTGRPVTLREDDYDLQVPELGLLPGTAWPNPFPVFLEIIRLYGRVSDVLNNINDLSDLTREKWQKLIAMESRLTKMYKSWDSRLQFNVTNFKAYLSAGQGTTFILLHFWFHALFIVLHQPTLLTPFGELRSELQLLPDSRELSMSSAKTICDILAFADLIDPHSFIGNPFTSQPIYIAACAFLMESSASASEDPSREASPRLKERSLPSNANHANHGNNGKQKSRHSLLASAANQNYQQCYRSLEHLQTYWGGVKYILTALDQKAKGIWDCETFTSEEYESTRMARTEAINGHLRFDPPTSSPTIPGPPIAWSLAGTANSPSSSLTLMYQKSNTNPAGREILSPQRQKSGNRPIGNPMDASMRQSVHAAIGMFPPPMPQATPSAAKGSPDQQQASHPARPSQRGQTVVKFEGLSGETEADNMYPSHHFASSSQPQQSSSMEAYNTSPPNTMADGNHAANHNSTSSSIYYSQGMPYHPGWGTTTGNMDAFTFDSQDIDIGALGLEQPGLMGAWLDYIPPDDVLGLFEHHDMGHGGQGGAPPGAP